MKKLLLWIAFSLCLMGVAAAETILVDPGGAGDYESITEALSAAQDGDELILAGGVYDETRETFPILVEKSVVMRAAEGEEPVIMPPQQVAGLELAAPGIELNGVRVDFLRSGLWVMADDVRVLNCEFALIDEAWRTSSCGAWIAGAKRMTMENCAFTGCGIAIAGPPISDSSAGLPVLTGMFEVGEDIEFFTTHTIENCYVNDLPLCYEVGLRDQVYSQPLGQLIAVQCEDVTFTSMDASRASIGIELAYCKDVVLERCIADDAGIFGIYVAKSEDCLVYRCRADRGAHGIDLRAIERCVVSECSSTGSGQGMFFSFAFDSLLSDCEIIENGTGFYASAGDGNQMHGCLIRGNQLGIYVQKEPNFTLTDTEFSGNWNTGARFTHADGSVCIGCTFEENWVSAMGLYSQGLLYQDNHFAGSENTSLYLQQVSGARLLENDFSQEGAAQPQYEDCENLLIWKETSEDASA